LSKTWNCAVEMRFLNRKLITDKCGFKNLISTAQFQVLDEIDRFLMTDLGLRRLPNSDKLSDIFALFKTFLIYLLTLDKKRTRFTRLAFRLF